MKRVNRNRYYFFVFSPSKVKRERKDSELTDLTHSPELVPERSRESAGSGHDSTVREVRAPLSPPMTSLSQMYGISVCLGMIQKID